jgi:hypothetical protein
MMFKVGDIVRQVQKDYPYDSYGDKDLVVSYVDRFDMYPYRAGPNGEPYFPFTKDELELAGEKQLELDL